MKHAIHRPSYAVGLTTGLLAGIVASVLLVKYVTLKMEMEDLRLEVSQAILILDGGSGSSPIDTLANTYGHCRMGLYSDQELEKRIAVARHTVPWR